MENLEVIDLKTQLTKNYKKNIALSFLFLKFNLVNGHRWSCSKLPYIILFVRLQYLIDPLRPGQPYRQRATWEGTSKAPSPDWKSSRGGTFLDI